MSAPPTDRPPSGADELLTTTRPCLRPEIVIGPATMRGAGVVHHVKDRRTGSFFQVGPKECFLLSRLDGTRTLTDIGDEYAERFGRELGAAQWRQLLDLLAVRMLLVGTEDEDGLRGVAETVAAGSRGHRTLLYARLPLVDPDRFLAAIEPRVRLLYSRPLVVALGLAVTAMVALVLTRIPELVADLGLLWRTPVLGVLALAALWGSLALHEIAHGLTCKHFGGQVTEIGVMWRMPLLAPYCKADDVVLFHRRGHRVATAFAGVFVSLVVLLPFGVLHLLTPGASGWHVFASSVLLMGTAAALLNVIPFLQLDGYHMLTHALGMANLRTDSYAYCRQLLRRDADLSAYPRRARIAYTSYGVSSVVFGCVLASAVVAMWFVQLSSALGPWAAAAVLVGEALVVTTVVVLLRRRRARRRASGTGSGPVARTRTGSAGA
ncbi:M50 family metallopeptidase [Pseudonocardia sp.]|uniref:M50 family metallopeptidase n=1 Tax=Pseudonocardia sp. TaxID=60912 RepID=UPI00262582C2|nr:M50 family metallopeptidase [Pseudonocardia sp.]